MTPGSTTEANHRSDLCWDQPPGWVALQERPERIIPKVLSCIAILVPLALPVQRGG